MPKSPEPPISRAEELARSELIGLPVSVSATRDPTLTGLTGTIVDESMRTLTIEADGERRVIGKLGQSFAFTVGSETIVLDGEDLAYRPEDRTKRASVSP